MQTFVRRGIMLDSVIERFDAPDSARIPIPTMLSARSHESTTACNLIDPILDVQTDWRWQKLKMTLDPTGRITAAYGKQHQPLIDTLSGDMPDLLRPIKVTSDLSGALACLHRKLDQWE